MPLPWKSIALLTLCLGLLTAGSALALYAWLLADLPPVTALETRMVRPTTRILDRNGRLLYEVIDPDAGKQISLSLEAIPPTCQVATIATEDERFYLHPGFDLVAIGRAAVQNARSGEIVSGASTITQQLARMLLLDPEERLEPSYKRKLREAWLAWRLDTRYTKDELLALYLNQTYYGNFAFGIEAAAQIFFAKPAAQLSRGECALLAGLIQYPGGYNPLSYPDVAKARQQTVLRLMQEAGYLSAADVAQIDREALRYRSRLFEINAPHFVIYVQDQLARELGPEALRAGGLIVTTTLDLDLQREVQRSVRRRLDLLNCRTPGLCDELTDPNRRISNAAAVVLDSHNGNILAMVGSPDYFDESVQGNVNAALSLRQPGSAIKPLTYAAAMDPALSAERGEPPLTPGDILADLPTTFYGANAAGEPETYTPLNYDRAFHGPVSIRTALASSYNIPAVKVLERIGVESLRRLAAQAGITSFTGDYGLALTLGGGEVRLLELAAAYGMLDDGVAVRPRGIVEVEGLAMGDCRWSMVNCGEAEEAIENCESRMVNCRDGAEDLEYATVAAAQSSSLNPQSPVIQPETAYLLTDMLADPIARRPAFGEGSVLELPFPAAVKTGTTTDWRDNWTVGYSTERIVGVWVGNADNTPMVGISGVDGAGPIWHDAMLAAHTDDPEPFARPEKIVEIQICGPSGMLPGPDCRQTRRERYITGTEPTEPDTQFRRIAIDRATGQPATAATPASRIEERTYWLLPPEYREWMVSQNIPVLTPSVQIGETGTAAGTAAGTTAASDSTQLAPRGALVLATPADLVTYQLHPGLPEASQRIELAGYAGDGTSWAELRLIVDDTPIAQARNATDLRAWWMLAPGEHRIWLEGEATDGGETIRSDAATVTVHPVEALQQNVRGR